MATITISKHEYENLKKKAEQLEQLKAIDFDLVRQFLSSKQDLLDGRFSVLA